MRTETVGGECLERCADHGQWLFINMLNPLAGALLALTLIFAPMLERQAQAAGFITAGFFTVADLPTTATLLQNGKVLTIGGSSAQLYDPATGTVSATGSMAQPLASHSATLLQNGKVLVAGVSNSLGGHEQRRTLRPCHRHLLRHRQHGSGSCRPHRYAAAKREGPRGRRE